MDYTKADVFVVDEETRQPLGRPWLTLAMDVCSRMVTGFYLTMEAPPRLSTSLYLMHSVFDKSAWLRERGITEPCPVGGLPDIIPVDNGAQLPQPRVQERSQIAVEWRPPGEPRLGGHIERLIGTQMGRLHLLPGTTFSNDHERGEYNSKLHAALTLREHKDEIPLRLPQDRLRFWFTFLPEQECTLRPTGVHLFGLRDWSAASASTSEVQAGACLSNMILARWGASLFNGHQETSWKPAMLM
ncbi:hypothetical protein QEZ48_00480 [Aquamicrobium lusatiense]|uniref:hypothetical protein n=1 Tax=Aquamicrobium lusatiense TaxID=89772 RepID=UPI002456C8DB|nr:hypothetical protein [Aquamicrobium lusatiense]MDH4989312.1 hypothetical protein [Aquamicrobium lusatiense]